MFEGSYGFVKDEAAKSAALLTRRLSGTEPEILYMKGEWEQAGKRADDLRESFRSPGGEKGSQEERLEELEASYIRKYS